MTWREQVITRILMIIAAMFADDAEIKRELKYLDLHIRQEGPKERQRALEAAGLVEED